MSLRGKVATVMTIPVLVLAASAALTFVAERRSTATVEATQHAYAVQHEIDAVLTDLVDAETGTRGLVLTGDPAYLDPYLRGVAAVRGDLHLLGTLTAGNPEQVASVHRLGLLITDRVATLAAFQRFAPISATTDRAAMVNEMAGGKVTMDTIRGVLSDLSAQESATLQKREASLESTRHILFLLAVIGAPGAVLLSLAVVFLSAERVVSRIGNIEDNARRLQRGEPLMSAGVAHDEIGELGRVLVETGAKLSDLQAELRRLATVDELTGLANRRGFLAVAEHQLRLTTRVKEPVALLFLDVDDLKPVNDVHGHATGDEMLREMAEIMVTTFRDADLLARVGGDEFCVLLATREDPGAKVALGRLNEITARRNLEPGRKYDLRFSVGLTEFDPESPVSIDSLMNAADGLMYEEKRAKRERRDPFTVLPTRA